MEDQLPGNLPYIIELDWWALAIPSASIQRTAKKGLAAILFVSIELQSFGAS